MKRITVAAFTLVIGIATLGIAQKPPDHTPALNVVATAHLDTQWRWTIRNTIEEYIPATFRLNFKLMDRYPHYVFSFEGAFKYMLLKEYYPLEFERLKPYIASGQWRLAGSWVDAVDVNIPSFESLTRQALYGNGYYKREFGKTSRDVMLPDCFGFGFTLPSIAAHCGLKSFSTQKLTWGSSVGVPFDIGIWEGVDGSTLVAGINPGSYSDPITVDLTTDTAWYNMIDRDGKKSGLYAGYKYFGVGDIGGAPDSASVEWLEKAQLKQGPLKVRSIGADDLVDIVASAGNVELPRYKGEFLMTRHGVGCYTSQTAMKRWNRKNEQLADATERASVIGHTLGVMTYPRQDLRETWIRFLWHQFHDDLTGTSIPEAYEFSWNDEILCQNRLAGMMRHAVEATTPALDTRGKGVPVVVYNPLAIDREDVVQATVVFAPPAPTTVRVFNPQGREVTSQVLSARGDSLTILFLAGVPSVGYAVFDVRPAEPTGNSSTELNVTSNTLENRRYRIKIDANGDVSSIIDKLAKRELLAAPITIQTLFDKPKRWPAWEIDYADIMAQPLDSARQKVQTRVVENGAARVGIEVTRKFGKSEIRTVVRLAAGDAGGRIEFENDVEWYERAMMLKAAFPLATLNDSITYDIGLGTIKRGLNHPELYEVPGQQWADMTSRSGDYGVAVLNDCKYGWDHPTDTTLRLTLIHTPGVYDSWAWVGDQKSMDNGHHEFLYALAGHTGDWRDGGVAWQAARLNQPLIAFQGVAHRGTLGKEYSFVSFESGTVADGKSAGSSHPQVMVNAVKLAELGDEIIVRVRELNGRPLDDASLKFVRPVVAAHEVNGIEESLRPAEIVDGKLIFSLTPYQPKAFSLTLAPEKKIPSERPEYQPIKLTYDLDGISLDADRRDGDFDGMGNSIAGDLLPDTVVLHDVPFAFGPKTPKAANMVRCAGQSIALPDGDFNRLYVITAAVGGPASGSFKIGDHPQEAVLPDYAERLGQWDNRMVSGRLNEEVDQIAPGYVLTTPVAWTGTHRHGSNGENEAYQFTNFFLLEFSLAANVKTVTLPNEPRIRVAAMTAVHTPGDHVHPSRPMSDQANGTVANITANRNAFLDSLEVRMSCPIPKATIHFTIDGTEPTPASSVYTTPLRVTQTTTVRARALLAGADDSYVSSSTFQKLVPHASQPAKDLAPGLDAAYFEGEWSKLPDFDSIAPLKKFVADTVAIPLFARKENYGLTMSGYLSIPTEGLYDFYLSSDDGSALIIGDTLLIDNDGLHGSGDVSGAVALKAGFHQITLRMFQAKGDQDLRLSIAGAGMRKQTIPRYLYFHKTAGKRR